MNLNGTIKKTQALSGRLLKSSGGGGSVQEIYWVHYGVGTATNAEVNEAVAANKLPICYWDSTDAYGRPRRTLYFLIRNTPTESFFSGVDYINNTIIVRRLYADAWDTQTIRYEGKLTWDTTPRFGSANPVTSGGIYNAIQNATVSDERIAEAVDDWLSVQAPSIGTLSYAAKQALLACFRHVAWIDDQGQSYYNALESELFPDATLESITALFSQGSATIYDTDSLDTLKQYLVVTATYSDSTTATVTDYTLSGTLTAGTSTITVSYGGKTATFDVTVTFNETPGPNLADFESRLYVPSNSKITTSIDSNNNIICVCNNSPSYANITFYNETPYLTSILENGKRYKIHFSFVTTTGSGSHVLPSLRKSDSTAAMSATELGVTWAENSGTFDGVWTQASDVCKLNIFLSNDTASSNSYTVVISDLWIKEVVSSET